MEIKSGDFVYVVDDDLSKCEKSCVWLRISCAGERTCVYGAKNICENYKKAIYKGKLKVSVEYLRRSIELKDVDIDISLDEKYQAYKTLEEAEEKHSHIHLQATQEGREN